MRLAATLSTLLTVIATAVRADPVPFHAIVPAECKLPMITGTPECVSDCPPTVTASAQSQTIDLDSRYSWVLRASAARCWSPPIRMPQGSTAISLRLYEAGSIKVKFALPRGATLESAITATLQSAPTYEPGTFEGPLDCTKNDDVYTCRGPAHIPIDLRVAVPGYASTYFFDATLDPALPLDLGVRPLVAGAAVTGWVRTARGAGVPAANITLLPRTAPGPENRVPLRSSATVSTTRGFFQLSGLASGEYTLRVQKPPLSTVEVSNVTVRPGEETFLGSVVARPLQELTTEIRPATDASGRAWRASLLRDHGREYRETLAEHTASIAGIWQAHKLNAGDYTLIIADGDGNIHERRAITLASGDERISIDIDDVRIRGRVHSGNRGIEAALVLRQNRGLVVNSTTNRDGDFTIVLPREGRWTASVMTSTRSMLVRKTFTVDSQKADASGYIPVDIDLPSGSIRGNVVDRTGQPVEDGTVFVTREDNEIGQAAIQRDGTFEAFGIVAGKAQLQAIKFGKGQSDAVTVDVTDDTDGVTLIYRPLRVAKGTIIGPDGQGVAGAIVRFQSSVFAESAETTAGPNGSWRVNLPDVEGPVDVVVLPGIYATKIISTTRDALDEPLLIRVGGIAGQLKIPVAGAPPWPVITRGAATVSALTLLYPRDAGGYPRGMTAQGLRLDLEAGPYLVCSGRRGCETLFVPPNGEAVFKGEQP